MMLLLQFLKTSADQFKGATTQQHSNVWLPGINHNFFLSVYLIKFVANQKKTIGRSSLVQHMGGH